MERRVREGERERGVRNAESLHNTFVQNLVCSRLRESMGEIESATKIDR